MVEYAVFIDPVNDVNCLIFFKDDLDHFYELIGCSLVEIDERRVGKQICNIIADEEGTFVENPAISAIDNLGMPMFVGPLIVAGKADEEGNLHGMTYEDAKAVQNLVMDMSTTQYPEPHPILTQCEYV